MGYLLRYLKHLFTATNHHGVHSPFVYDYVTKCLYSGRRSTKKKSVDIFVKSIAYFKVQTLLLPGEEKNLKSIIEQSFQKLQIGVSPYGMVFEDASNLEKIEILIRDGEKIRNNSMVLIDNIHKTKTNEVAWQQLKKNNKVTVTIDLYYCGLVFFRKEQAKEHFKIRI